MHTIVLMFEYYLVLVAKLQVAYLSVIGGVTVRDTVRRIMAAVLTNGLAEHFNFKGHGIKRAFEALQLKDIINGENFLVTYL